MTITRNFTSGSPPAADRVTSAAPTILVTNAVAAGDLIVVAIVFEDAAITVTSITDTSTNSYVQAGTYQRDGASPSTSCIFYCLSAAAASGSTNTVTIHLSGSILVCAAVQSVTSSGVTWSLDQNTGATGTTGNPASGSVTTLSASEYVVACAYGDTASCQASGSITPQYTHTPLGGLSFEASGDAILTSTTSINGTFTQNTTGQSSAKIATFAATPSGPAVVLSATQGQWDYALNPYAWWDVSTGSLVPLGIFDVDEINGSTWLEEAQGYVYPGDTNLPLPSYASTAGEELASTAATLAPDEPGSLAYLPAALPDGLALFASSEDFASLPLDEGAASPLLFADAPPTLPAPRGEDFAGFLTVDDSAGPTASPLPDPGSWWSFITAANEDNPPSLTIDDATGAAVFAYPDAGTQWPTVSANLEDLSPSLTVDDSPGPAAIARPDAGQWLTVVAQGEDNAASFAIDDSAGPIAWPSPDLGAWLSVPANVEDFAPLLTVDDSAGPPAWAPGDASLWISVTALGEDTAPTLTLDDSAGPAPVTGDPGTAWIGPYAFGEDVRGLPVTEEQTFTWQAPDAPAWVTVAAQGEDFGGFLTVDDSPWAALITPDPPSPLTFQPSEDIASTTATIVDDVGGPSVLFFELQPPRLYAAAEDFAGFLTIDDSAGSTPLVVDVQWAPPANGAEDFTATSAVVDEPPGAWSLFADATFLTAISAGEDSAPLLTLDDAAGPAAIPLGDLGTWVSLTAAGEDTAPSLTIDDSPGVAIAIAPDVPRIVYAASEDFTATSAAALDDGGQGAWLSLDPLPLPELWTATEDLSRATAPFDESGPVWVAPELPTWLTALTGEDFAASTTAAIDEGSALWTPTDAPTWAVVSIAAEDFAGLPVEEAGGAPIRFDATSWLSTPTIAEDFAGLPVSEDGAPAILLPPPACVPVALTIEDPAPTTFLEEPPGAVTILQGFTWAVVNVVEEIAAPLLHYFEPDGWVFRNVEPLPPTAPWVWGFDEFYGVFPFAKPIVVRLSDFALQAVAIGDAALLRTLTSDASLQAVSLADEPFDSPVSILRDGPLLIVTLDDMPT